MDLREEIQKKISEVAAVANYLPGVVIIHNVQDDCVEYMSERGLSQLMITREELKQLGKEYHVRFFNPEDAKDYVPKIFGLIERNNDEEMITFFQQVRPNENHEFKWHLTSVKILMRDMQGKALLCISFAVPIDEHHHLTAKVSRLLDENAFLRINYQQFIKLSDREKQILKLMALGKSSPDIAANLFISVKTAETHRRNIRQKLRVTSSYEIAQYARAFDLI